jgi:hypothetical protein
VVRDTRERRCSGEGSGRDVRAADAIGMTKSTIVAENAPALRREPRPFLHLAPAALPTSGVTYDARGAARLDDAVSPQIPQLVRSLVDWTIALQNRRALERGRVQPIQVSVLNRRRRAARSWLLAIAAGRTDAATSHAVASQWLPLLAATGPDHKPTPAMARALVEFVRGALTACVFDDVRANLLDDAKALHVLETTLAVHLAAVLPSA